MNYRDLTKPLKDLGCFFARQARGSHEIWQNSDNGAFTTIPNLGNKDIPQGTIARILRDLRIPPQAFRATSRKHP